MSENKERTKRCTKCGRILPLENFRLENQKSTKPYYRGECKACESEAAKKYVRKRREKNGQFDDDIEMIFTRQYKQIHPARILDLSQTGLQIELLGKDEIFVRLMDYKDTWLSNYGRLIRKSYSKYKLLSGTQKKGGELRYSASKCIYQEGKWGFKRDYIYTAQAIVDTFIINQDKERYRFIWHKGFKQKDFYYKNLYPLTEKQYYTVKEHFNLTGEDSEEYILKVMNDIRFKDMDWSAKYYIPTVCSVGYHGCGDVDSKSAAYFKWKNMLNRCYNENSSSVYAAYADCEVCEEWKSFNNFRQWYEKNRYVSDSYHLDKDILFKGNNIYSPETCCLVPKEINQLFIKLVDEKQRTLPIGVYADKDCPGKYRAEMNAFGKTIRIGSFDNPDKAFQAYKEYKEKFIKDTAARYKDKIPYKVYETMMSRQVEIND